MGPEVMGTCSSMKKGLDPEVVLDEHGWPTICSDIIMSEVAVDDDVTSDIEDLF